MLTTQIMALQAQARELGLYLQQREAGMPLDEFFSRSADLLLHGLNPKGAERQRLARELKLLKREIARLKGERTLLLKRQPSPVDQRPMALHNMVKALTQAARLALVEQTLDSLRGGPDYETFLKMLRCTPEYCNLNLFGVWEYLGL